MKECFGACGGFRLKWSSRSTMHYIVIDEEKMKECETCDQFAQCAWRVQINMFRQLIRWHDEKQENQPVSL